MLAITDGRTIVTLAAGPGSQAGLRRRRRAQHGRHGRLLPRAAGRPTSCCARIEEHVLVPTVHQMKRSRRPFRGVLYAGLMITNQGPKVLEYNVRFGDPECQPIADAAARAIWSTCWKRPSTADSMKSLRSSGIRGRPSAS